MKATGLAGTAGLAGLSGCSSFMGGGGNKQLLLMHGWSPGDGLSAIKNMYQGFEKEYPDVDSKLKGISGGGNTTLNTVINNRLKKQNPPGSWADWPGKNLLQFQSKDGNILGDIGDSVWSKNKMKKAYAKGPRNAGKPDGTYICVPTNIHRMNNVFYNKKVLKQAGVSPGDLKSPKDLTDAMKKVDKNTDAVGMAQSTKSPWTTLQLWGAVFLGQQGWDGYQKFMDGSIGKEPIANAFKTLADYSKYFSDDAGTIGFKEGNKKVMNGNAAFIQQGDWVAGMYAADDSFEYKKDWDYVAFPGTEGYYAMNMDSWVYPKNTPAPDAAKKWLRYAGTKDAQVRFNSKKGSIPPRTDVSMKKFPEFQSDQYAAFKKSKAQPPSVAHGLAVIPTVQAKLESAVSQNFSSYKASSADKVAQQWKDAISSSSN
ncbi:ABC transporter substrate-binding protein [Haladaptatus sp. R4]|uniref:ABC transporter substrate-binding protein n=1 Tax=Haladaptatus sp. R4 TaxID=1679489 RepID=UPI0009EEA311|nr:ABC transporter substrate-binding protein [Haladaptatus sp. R4]